MAQKSCTDTRLRNNIYRTILMLVIIVVLYIPMQYFNVLDFLIPSKLADADMSLGFLFLFGLMTSLHCIALCGGINLSQSLSKRAVSDNTDTLNQPQNTTTAGKTNSSRLSVIYPSILYNAGRVTAYTIAGTVFGAIGYAFTFSMYALGIFRLIAGVFIVLMGLSMLGIFPQLRRFTPGMPRLLSDKIDKSAARRKSPFIVGMFNWLMPCGPLQAAHLYALSTGSPLTGGLSMMLFALGTVPLKLGLGMFGSFVGKSLLQKIILVGGLMAAVIGLCMFSQGLIIIRS